MQQPAPHPATKILTVLLSIIVTFSFQTGHFLLGAVTLIAYGIVLIATQKSWQRVLGGVAVLFGLYVLALVLGFLGSLLLGVFS